MSLEDFNNSFNENEFAFIDFVKANVHQSKSEKKNGLIEDQQMNYHRPSNTFYILDGDNVHTLNNKALQGVYVIGGHPYIKLDPSDSTELCEVIHMTERMYVYLHGGKTYARIGNVNTELERSCASIENTFGVECKNINKYISINSLDINQVEDFKLILKQYENYYYNNN
jgi:hypothetical protein